MKGLAPVEAARRPKIVPFDGHAHRIDIAVKRTPTVAHFAPGVLFGIASAPGQKPRLLTSCEYASRVIASGKCGMPPGCFGAARPEKRVTARSGAPQKKWTGLHFPQKLDRNSLKTRSVWTRTRQNRLAYSGSYERCCSSRSNGIGFGISFGSMSILTARSSSFSAAMTAL